MEITSYPNEEKKDKIYNTLKAIVSDVPIVGGTVSELLFSFFSKPVDKRREKWFNDLAETIINLEENAKGINDIVNSDIFITTVLKTTEIAIKTHQEEKLEYLKNIVKNSILIEDIGEMEKIIFLEIISDYTPLHIKVLLFMSNPKKCLKEKSYKNRFTNCAYREFLLEYIPEVKGKEMILKKIEKDLYNDGLTFNSEYINSTYSYYGNVPENIPDLKENITSFGKMFFRYLL